MKSGSEPVAAVPVIVGCARSGTTLLRAMFDSHPDLAIVHESVHWLLPVAKNPRRYQSAAGFLTDRFIADLMANKRFGRMGFRRDDLTEALTAPKPSTLPDAIRRVFSLFARSQGKPRYGDKSPDYILHIPLIAALLHEARFIHVIRDGRDVAGSLLELEWGPSRVEQAAIYWKRRVGSRRTLPRWLGPDRYREVRYEVLVSEPEPTLRELCSFVGLDFVESMLWYHKRAERIVAPTSLPHRQQRLFLPPTAGLREWRRDMLPRDIERFEALAGGLLEELGYPRVTSDRISSRVWASSWRVRGGARRMWRRVLGVGQRAIRKAWIHVG